MSTRMDHRLMAPIKSGILPYSIDFSALPDGALPAPWTGATWTIATGKALNTPVPGANVVINGGFDADTNWNKTGGWSIDVVNFKATHAAAVAGLLSQTAIQTLGRWYQLEWTMLDRTAGGCRPEFGSNWTNPYQTTNEATIDTGRAYLNNPTVLYFNAQAAFDGSVDSVTEKPLTLTQLMATLPAISETNVTIELAIDTYSAKHQIGIVMNLDSATTPLNFVLCISNNNQLRLEKCINGVYTLVLSVTFTPIASPTIKVVKTGTSYAMSYNGVQLGATQTISDATIINNKIHGMFSTRPESLIGTYDVV